MTTKYPKVEPNPNPNDQDIKARMIKITGSKNRRKG